MRRPSSSADKVRIDLGVITVQGGLLGSSRVTSDRLLDLDELSCQTLAILGGDVDVTLYRFFRPWTF